MNHQWLKSFPVRVGGGAAAFLTISGPSIAQALVYEETITVGTNYTRTSKELMCINDDGCTHNWNHDKKNNCSVSTSVRIRHQRDFIPDETSRGDYNFTGCEGRGWKFTQGDLQRHHHDGKVSSGTGIIKFAVR